MSLILEALRKSEAERRRGQAPDVAMELPPASVPRAPATATWLLPALLLVAIALLAAWWWSQRDGNEAGDEAPAIATPVQAPRIATPAPAVVIAQPVQTVAPPVAAPAVAAAAQPTAAVVEAVPAPVRPLPAPTPAATPADRPELAEIDSASMPGVKLSMHMWDESPTRRFVILNGQRMAEGDRNGDITVIAIERDGVVVERNGQRARVPLP